MSAPVSAPLAHKRRMMAALRVGGVALMLGALILVWSEPAALTTILLVLNLIVAAGHYLVEARYSRALERALARPAAAD